LTLGGFTLEVPLDASAIFELEEARAGGAAWKRAAVDRLLVALEAAAQALDI